MRSRRLQAWWLVAIPACGFQVNGSAPADGAGDGPRPDVTLVDAAIDMPTVDSPPASTCPSDSHLIACYQFENNLTDGSGNGNHATSTINVTYGNGHTGRALNTAVGVISAPASSDFDLTDLTMKVWVRPTSVLVTGRGGVIDSNGFRMFMESGNRIRCAINDATNSVTTVLPIVIGLWTRVTCTYDRTQLRVYFDGIQVAVANVIVDIDTNTTPITIGHNEPTGENFPGQLDELEIWDDIQSP